MGFVHYLLGKVFLDGLISRIGLSRLERFDLELNVHGLVGAQCNFLDGLFDCVVVNPCQAHFHLEKGDVCIFLQWL